MDTRDAARSTGADVDFGATAPGLVVARCFGELWVLDAEVEAGRGVAVGLLRGGTESGRTRGEGVRRGAGTCTGWKADRGFALGEEVAAASGCVGESVAGPIADGRLSDGTCAARADGLPGAALVRADC